ncbi:MAG TPA: solute carrier family 23 protein [Micavibrio sp.]
MTTNAPHPWWHPYTPKLFTYLKQGYSLKHLRADTLAGLTVAIVALPLAMALGIASGAGPAEGLITVVIAGLLISALGGSRYQIGGPTGAFVVVIYNVINTHGYDGLITATLMAGVILTLAGFARLGTLIRHIPSAVITGFTAGIAIIIFSSQIKDLFGLQIEKVPGEFFEKWHAFWMARDSISGASVIIAASALALLIVLRKYAPKWPGFLIAVIWTSGLVALFNLNAPTIGSVFGGIPDTLPLPRMPDITVDKMILLLPSALTIAFLAGIESLLSATVADRMTNRQHRSNAELIAQGIANTASSFWGGLPATGAIARTATNIRAGAYSPMSGVLHAVFVLLFMLFLAPLASFVPLAGLAAILVLVAWNMSERHHVWHTLKGAWPEKIVLLATLLLTVTYDLTVAIIAGVALSLLFRMIKKIRAA